MSVKAARDFEQEQISTDDFHSLEEKVYRTIELLKEARAAKAAAERETARVREQMAARDDDSQHARQEVIALRREREEVKSRVEKLLKQIDLLTAEETGR